MNVPNGLGSPKGSPKPEAEADLLKENISLPAEMPSPGKKTLSDWQP
jgi:hypothetical protein